MIFVFLLTLEADLAVLTKVPPEAVCRLCLNRCEDDLRKLNEAIVICGSWPLIQRREAMLERIKVWRLVLDSYDPAWNWHGRIACLREAGF